MEPFIRLHAVAAPLHAVNVDTDRIIPARFLKKNRGPAADESNAIDGGGTSSSVGYSPYLFHDMRFDERGREIPEFTLNRPEFRDAEILVAGTNFGCGSSREGAVWALLDHGFRCVIAPSFGDIFYQNSCKNGVLPVRLGADIVASLQAALEDQPGSQLLVDLEEQRVELPDGRVVSFDIDGFRKTCLLGGLDDVDLTLEHDAALSAFEDSQRKTAPWLYTNVVETG